MLQEKLDIVFNLFNGLQAPGVYRSTKGQASVEWIGMALAVLAAVGVFLGIVTSIVREKSAEINSSW